jgi:hypothetical protein
MADVGTQKVKNHIIKDRYTICTSVFTILIESPEIYFFAFNASFASFLL